LVDLVLGCEYFRFIGDYNKLGPKYLILNSTFVYAVIFHVYT